jgi:hypothetical protein
LRGSFAGWRLIAGVLVLIASSELYLPEAVQHIAALVIAVGSAIVAMLWL